MENLEAISNPQPPPPDEPVLKQTQLSNSDFRKLLFTSEFRKPPKDASMPRGRSDRTKSHSHKPNQKSRSHHHRSERKQRRGGEEGVEGGGANESGKSSERPPKYRDRARERREGKISSNMENLDSTIADGAAADGAEDREDEHNRLIRTADYRAVGPTSGASHAAERRRAIEESKYFGGDMDHTHLVKGLDYVLLEKVRREIENKEREAEEQLDAELERPIGSKDGAASSMVLETGLHFKTRLAEGIIETLFKTSNQNKVERNEFFQPGRMAYRVELEDEMAEFEVPATVIRSKADCLLYDQSSSSGNSDLTTNDIVINKLAQIFAYTRAGRRQAKKAKMGKVKPGGVQEYDIQPLQQEAPKKKPQRESLIFYPKYACIFVNVHVKLLILISSTCFAIDLKFGYFKRAIALIEIVIASKNQSKCQLPPPSLLLYTGELLGSNINYTFCRRFPYCPIYCH